MSAMPTLKRGHGIALGVAISTPSSTGKSGKPNQEGQKPLNERPYNLNRRQPVTNENTIAIPVTTKHTSAAIM